MCCLYPRSVPQSLKFAECEQGQMTASFQASLLPATQLTFSDGQKLQKFPDRKLAVGGDKRVACKFSASRG